jgi:hypothetical protein
MRALTKKVRGLAHPLAGLTLAKYKQAFWQRLCEMDVSEHGYGYLFWLPSGRFHTCETFPFWFLRMRRAAKPVLPASVAAEERGDEDDREEEEAEEEEEEEEEDGRDVLTQMRSLLVPDMGDDLGAANDETMDESADEEAMVDATLLEVPEDMATEKELLEGAKFVGLKFDLRFGLDKMMTTGGQSSAVKSQVMLQRNDGSTDMHKATGEICADGVPMGRRSLFAILYQSRCVTVCEAGLSDMIHLYLAWLPEKSMRELCTDFNRHIALLCSELHVMVPQESMMEVHHVGAAWKIASCKTVSTPSVTGKTRIVATCATPTPACGAPRVLCPTSNTERLRSHEAVHSQPLQRF